MIDHHAGFHMRKKVFLDTEFTGLTQQAQFISLALVSEDGREFYAEFTYYDSLQLTDWHREHVIANLLPNDLLNRDGDGQVWLSGDIETVRERLRQWLSGFEAIEIWADVLAWDWVLFCELFGGAFGIPKNIYYIPFDLATLLQLKGLDPDMDRAAFIDYKDKDGLSRHNALYDARMELGVYQKVMVL